MQFPTRDELMVLANQQVSEKRAWIDTFSDDWNRTRIPFDKRPAGGVYQYEKGVFAFSMDATMSKEMWELSNRSDHSLHILLLAMVLGMAKKFTCTDNLTVGTLLYRDSTARRVNRILPIRYAFDEDNNLKTVLRKTWEKFAFALKNQNFPIDCLPSLLDLSWSDCAFPLFDILVSLDTIHEVSDADTYRLPLVLSFGRKEDRLTGVVTYNSLLYSEGTVGRLVTAIRLILKQWLSSPEKSIRQLAVLSVEDRDRYMDTGSKPVGYPENDTIPAVFARQVAQYPDHIAVSVGNASFTYGFLDERAGLIAGYIRSLAGLPAGSLIGILMEKSIDCIGAILGVLQCGCAYVPIDPAQPEERIKSIVDDAEIGLILSESRYIKTLNRLQWECRHFTRYICLDSDDADELEETEENDLMNKELWEYIAETAVDDISAGGWKSSYTGHSLSREEMDEYSDNIVSKLSPYLTKETRILEIGCASGLSMYRLAPLAGYYLGTDISASIIEKNRERVRRAGIGNIGLAVLAAHEIDQIREEGFDIIIMNSVVQHFHGHNYLKKVLRKCLGLLKEKGLIFIGDIMDQEKREDLIREMTEYKQGHSAPGITTKTDWASELFLSRSFFEDLCADFKDISALRFSEKEFRIENELTRFRYDVLLFAEKERDGVMAVDKRKFQDDARRLPLRREEAEKVGISPGDTAYIIYTSGTTGKPKGALITHRNVVRLFCNDTPLFDFSEKDVWTMFHSVSFDFSVWEMYGALLFGGRLILIPRPLARDADAFLEVTRKERVTVLNQTPSAFTGFIHRQQLLNDTLDLRYVILGGEAIQPAALVEWKKQYPWVKLVNMYGITETTVHVTYKELTDEVLATGVNNIGKPIPTLAVHILDEGMNLLPPGAIGEIFVEGEGVGNGYLRREELTRTRFLVSPFRKGQKLYRSGDRARYLDNGELEYLGRNDRQVKIRGFRIELSEIESQLLRYSAIMQAHIRLMVSADEDKYLVAYYISGEPLDPDRLRSYLEGRLPEYMIPAFFIPLTALPLTVNGKINVRELPEPERTLKAGYIAPRDAVESKLVGIWSEILAGKPISIGIDDDFFESGGHSLKATQLMSAVQAAFGVKIPIARIFKTPTIRALANEIRVSAVRVYDTIEKIAPAAYYLLSSAQQRIFILDRLEMGSKAYQIPIVLKIAPKPEIGRLERAFRKLIERHEVFRSYFEVVGNQPVQKILAEVRFEVLQLPGNNRNTSELFDTYMEGFDLGVAPLIKVAVATSKDHGEIVLINLHHVIADGVSIAILHRELFALYKEEVLEDFPVQYKDYAVWQSNRLTHAKDALFWKNEFSKACPAIDLPYSFPRPAVRSEKGDRVLFGISRQDTQLLYTVSRQYNCTLFITLLSLFKSWLYRLSGQTDLVVGTPVSGRDNEALNGLIGVFINTLPIRSTIAENGSFEDLLLRVRDKVIQVFEHGAYPYERIIEDAKIERDASRNSLFDVMLILQNWQDSRLQDEETNIELVPYENKTSKLDMTLEVVEIDGELQCSLEYCTALFSREMAIRLAGWFTNVVVRLAGDTSMLLKDVRLPGEEERSLVLDGFNDTAAFFPADSTIHDVFEELALRSPDRIAVIQDGCHLSLHELNRRSDELAGRLQHAGVIPNTIIAIMMERSVEMVISILGILKAGGCYMPIDAQFPPERIGYMLKDSLVGVLIRDDGRLQFAEEGILEIDIKAHGPAYKRTRVELKPHDLAYLIYTSGSTGRPKGVLIEHASLMNRLWWMQNYYKLDEKDTVLQKTPYTFDVSVWELFLWILGGCRLALLSAGGEKDAETIIRAVDSMQVTILHFVPTMLNAFLEYIISAGNAVRLSSLRFVVASGEGLPVRLVGKFRRAMNGFNPARLYNLYGPTEATVDVSFFDTTSLDLAADTLVPIGKPIDNTRLYVVRGENELQGIGLSGELWIAGSGVGKGYLNRVDLTMQRFPDDPFDDGSRVYRTGDLAHWNKDGYLFFEGRTDRQVKNRGYRIELGEIEHVISRYAGVTECVVRLLYEPGNEGVLTAFYTGSEVSAEALDVYVQSRLPDYMVPQFYITIDTVPVTPNGKVNYDALPSPVGKASLSTSTDEVRSPVEELLMGLWESVLGRSGIGPEDNFFSLGGDSIKSIQLQSRLIPNGLYVEGGTIFRYPVLKDLAKRVKPRKRRAEQGAISGKVPMTPIQLRFFEDLPRGGKDLHYNQAVLLFSEKGFIETDVVAVFSRLQQHHDVLRVQFKEEGDHLFSQHIADNDLPISLEIVDYRNGGFDDELFGRKLDEIQRRVKLSEGPLMRLCLYHTDRGDYLQIVIHHLVIDGISWRILLEDADNLLDLAARKAPLALPDKTDSFKYWSERLTAYASGDELRRNIRFWEKNEEAVFSRLPRKRPAEAAQSTYGSFSRQELVFDKAFTFDLLGPANRAYNTDIADLLLTALSFSIQKVFGIDKIAIWMEGHGREDFLQDVDVSRTIGWFTSLYPTVVSLDRNDTLSRVLIAIKDQFNQVPYHGAEYGLLRYLSAAQEGNGLHFELFPEIVFNFLGQFSTATSYKTFSVDLNAGQAISDKLHSPYPLEVSGIVSDGQLCITIGYDRTWFGAEDIELLFQHMERSLRETVLHCLAKEQSTLTASDFMYKDLSRDQLDDILKIYDITS